MSTQPQYQTYSDNPEIVAAVAELAASLTPPSDIASLLDIDVNLLRMELADRRSAVSIAYYKAKAQTASMLRTQEIKLAAVGSPMAVQLTGMYLRDMTSDEDF